MRKARDLIKVKRVIESCKTLDQCLVASSMIYAYERFYGVVESYLDILLEVRESLIRKQGGKSCASK